MTTTQVDKNLKIISVHIPKCAGTSFLNWLKDAFGQASVLQDYDDKPMDPSSICNMDPVSHKQKVIQNFSQISNGKKVVHGHFLASKYDFIPNYKITFLRNPIERALSNYFYWMSVPVTNNKLHEYVVNNNLEWEDFVSLPIISKIYSGLFFENIDMKTFDFIGDCAIFEDELQRFGGGAWCLREIGSFK